MKAFSFSVRRLMCALLASLAVTQAFAEPDSTPPTLAINQTWITKVGTKFAFNLLLDPRDETGIDQVQQRFKINSTVAVPDTTPWVNISPWIRGQPLVITQACTSIVIEVRALDAAGNVSPVQRRIFKAPFPLSTAPNFETKFVGEKVFLGSGPTFDCRGLFGADFDGDGRDDILQVDRASGIIKVRRQQSNGTFVSNGFNVAVDAVSDSAVGDFNGDGRPDLALVVSGGLVVYKNDGLVDVSGIVSLKFSVMDVGGLATTGISTVVGIAAGDVTGEGKDDLVITGTGDDGMGGNVAKIAILLHNDQHQLGASNHSLAFPNSSAGQVRLGDVTGDGKIDAVMIDAANNQVLLFMNKGGIFGGADDAEPAARPIATATASAPAQSIAVGDITGDGRADLVVTLHRFGDFGTGSRDNLFVQYFDSRGAAPFRSNGLLDGGFGPVAASSTPFRSDVMLRDLNDDGLPEVVIASPFQVNGSGAPGGIRAWRFDCQLDNANLLTYANSFSFSYATGSASPHRLASARFQSTRADVLLASGDNAEAVQFVLSTYTSSSKIGYDLLTGASTDSDTSGSPALNGLYNYYVDVGGVVTYSLNYVNNSDALITGAVLDCLLPPTVSLISADDNAPLVPAGTSKYVRWSLGDVAAHTSGVKNFSVRVLAGKEDGTIALKGNFKRGTTVLVTTPMPVIVLDEPLKVDLSVTSDSDSNAGARAHVDEVITYRMRIQNEGTGTISGFKASISVPANTTFYNCTFSPAPTLVSPPKAPFGVYSSATWNSLNLAPGATIELFLAVKVNPTVATGAVITCNTFVVTRADGTVLNVPKAVTAIQSPLEISISSDKNIARPGEVIRYTLRVQNWLHKALTFGRVVNELPAGTALYRAGANDGTDAPVGGTGNFRFGAGSFDASQLSLNTLPCYDSAARIMTWALSGVPADAIRTIEYEVIVAQDIPTTASVGGVSSTLEIQNKAYNFAATVGSTRIFAGTPKGGATANGVSAHSSLLLSTVLPVRRSLLSDPPLDAPKLVLIKDALGDGEIHLPGETIDTVINDTTITTDGFCDYRLSYFNFGAGTARNVRVRDYVPANMTFVGNIWRSGTPIPSLVGCHFYDAAGKEMPVIGAEGFTDVNGNGFYDAGEPFTDANGNRKYDGVTASLVKSMDFPAGDLSIGLAGSFTYRTKTTANPGTYITSPAGGITGVKNGLEYTKVAGYHLTADNLHFPVNGSPKQVKVLITGPATFDFPAGVIKSRAEMVGTEITEIAIPYELLGGSALSLSGVKMTVTIPKGYLVTDAVVQDDEVPPAQSRTGTIVRNAAGIATLTFPINDWHKATALFRVQLDPATKSVLKGTRGEIKTPLAISATLSGTYFKGSKTVAIGGLTRLLGSLPVRDVSNPSFSSGPSAARITAAAAGTAGLNDAKIFVGRCAPVSVKRLDTFSYTIFVGNLTDFELGLGTIEMSVPAGCDYVSASNYKYNAPGATSDDVGGTFGIAPKRVGSKVTWQIGNFAGREGGAVTLTVKVRDDFNGTRIDDNTCIFDVQNASGKTPGQLGVVVRTGNETTQSVDILGSAASGLGVASGSDVTDALRQSFTLDKDSCTITTGGADIVQLKNGVIVVQLQGGRVMTVGPPDKTLASGIRLVKDDAMLRVAVGPGDSNGVQLTKLPMLASGVVQPANMMLGNLHVAGSSLVAAGGGNLVAAGGGNLVAAGAGHLVGNDGASINGSNGAKLVGNDGASFTNVAGLVAAGGGNLVGNDGSTLVAAGGGNLVAAGGGNLVAAGGGNAIGSSNPLVAAGGLNLIGQDGGSLVAAGGGNLVAAGGGNLVAAGGLNLIPNK